MKHFIKAPYEENIFRELRTGDTVFLSGTIYSARDAAHRRLIQILEEGRELPFDIKNAIIYYAGPTPAKPGHPIGSAGPTTSYRMDSFTPALLDEGLIGMIGKGPRNQQVIDGIRKRGAVYFAAIGGAAALIAQSVVSAEVVAFADLGTEAIRKIEVADMPLIVAVDSLGNDIYRK